MKLAEIFDQLTFGELAQHYIGGREEFGAIQPNHYWALIPHINMALTKLYTRFPLRSEEVIIELDTEISLYKLHTDFAQTNTTSIEPIKYIADSMLMPFEDNVISIRAIYNEVGEEYILNDESYWKALMTPSYNTIQHPYADEENVIHVIYQAGPDKIALESGGDPREYEIDLPDALLEPLLYFVISRLHTGLVTQEVEGMNTNYRQLFEESCRKAEELGLFRDTNWGNTKFDEQGWI